MKRRPQQWGWRQAGLAAVLAVGGGGGWPLIASTAHATSGAAPTRRVAPGAHVDYGKLTAYFEANRGQAPAQYSYLAHGPGYLLALGAHGATLSLHRPGTRGASGRTASVQLGFWGANSAPHISGVGR